MHSNQTSLGAAIYSEYIRIENTAADPLSRTNLTNLCRECCFQNQDSNYRPNYINKISKLKVVNTLLDLLNDFNNLNFKIEEHQLKNFNSKYNLTKTYL